jgi:hypothetical protein
MRTGMCVEGYCAFRDGDCSSDYRWDSTAGGGRAGLCVPGGGVDAGPDEDATVPNTCGGTRPLPGREGDACGLCGLGTWICDGPDSLSCFGEPTVEMNATPAGDATASSDFGTGYEPLRAIDGNDRTSWFSGGGSGPDTYEWAYPVDICITGIRIIGNDLHADTTLQTDHGYESVRIEVVSELGSTTYSSDESLAGTPDPQVFVAPEALGQRVRLTLTGPESTERSGFSELVVTLSMRE